MIILKHLTIERFRLLRSVSLHFPQRGSILIQGPNEAGKSALVESMYFALYGEPLVTRRGNRSLNDLILYGAVNATVSLTLSIGATELAVTRTIVRDQGQQVSLLVHHLGMPDEAVLTDIAEVNARIIAEIGNIDSESLRDAGLVEQKGLTRLESLAGPVREAAMRRLLGLDTLTDLSTRFCVTEEDEAQLVTTSERLHLAEVQDRIPHLEQRLTELADALDAVQVNEHLAAIDQQEDEVASLERSIEEIQEQRIELKGRLSRVQQLKKASTTLSEIITSYDDMAEARHELPLLEQQIVDLERREREDLPRIEKRVNDLAELTRSFGTLERMSNDFLSAVDSIHELELELKDYQDAQQGLKALDDQIVLVRERLAGTWKSLQELEERRRSSRPPLEDRVQRLNVLRERLNALRAQENQYTERLTILPQAEERTQQFRKASRALEDAEQEYELLENEARLKQHQADEKDQAWRQVNIRRLLVEWCRLKGLADSVSLAEQQVHNAHQHQAELTSSAREARKVATQYLVYLSLCALGCAAFLIIAVISLSATPWLAIITGIFVLILLVVGVYNYRKYHAAHIQENTLKVQEQEAISQVSMMVTAREEAKRLTDHVNALQRIEQEIRAFNGKIPQSQAEAQQYLDTVGDQDNVDALREQMKSAIEAATAARMQADEAQGSVKALRTERDRLESLRGRERWDSIEEDLRQDQASIELLQQEVTLLAAQENLPIPSINARIQASPLPSSQSFTSGSLAPIDTTDDLSSVPELETLIGSTIKATEHEIVSLDSKLDQISDLSEQRRQQQEMLDTLMERRSALEERAAYKGKGMEDPLVQVERAREQQIELRSALQSLKDSLRQRVKPLGVEFGQTAIVNAENVARKQLEELNITLGKRIMLQERLQHYTDVLKSRQESLSEHYKQLAKFSNTLGSWIIPLNPFADVLIALRSRCLNEIQEADEEGIVQHLDDLLDQDADSRSKVEACQTEIQHSQDAIVVLLQQRDRPSADFARATLHTVWPLIEQYTADDRQSVEDERSLVEQELQEQQSLQAELREKLGLEDAILDLAQAQMQMEQQERSYDVKKHGQRLLEEAEKRLLRKVQPRTEHYMQLILPLLTAGRYHEVQLTAEPEEDTISGGTFQIQVWDSTAGEYVPTSALSGGAADQLSLALRLAFAIATLSGDLNAALGFVILDEPLSSFDRGRAQALVNVVTGEVLSQHFEQIILLSYSSAFDPAMFPYHVYIDNGLVIESNLPMVPVAPVTTLAETPSVTVTPFLDEFDEDDQDNDATMAIPAIKLPLSQE